MTGKEKCEFLKEIRKNMAKVNKIPYEPRECHHEGECSGTCPLCEREAAELLAMLKKKALNGEEIQVDNEAIELLEQVSSRCDKFYIEDNQPELLGDLVDEKEKLMGCIGNVYWLHQESESKPEKEPDIVWNMDDEGNPIISPSANIKNKDVESKEENE